MQWGVLGAGRIARSFIAGLRAVEDAELAAVGSRSAATARAFADEFAIPRAHGGYRELAEDPDVDVVYVATPHPFHHAATLLCLEAGKHVLCEKPLAINAAETAEMIAAARRCDRFLMEAMWTRFSPAMREVARVVADGEIGEVRMLTADFGGYRAFDPADRAYAPELGGGALLDLGIYPLALASQFLGPITAITAQATLAPTGVDARAGLVVTGAGGGIGSLACALDAEQATRAVVSGTKGRVEIEHFYNADAFTLHLTGRETREFTFPRQVNGYEYEAAEVTRLVREDERESSLMPLDETLSIARLLDEARRQVGVRYPGEDRPAAVGTHRGDASGRP
ncbi:putative dehydrogenase [Murinocardiopsis flavida]|uniref:Putative dehydrogenase n=1 Tax=Murinocardiopsis flavida TaxID=645275 RepID=A0A2P8CF12_9ACTN|nr:putative dehydrogenase [Murinocardiopsis flavida]